MTGGNDVDGYSGFAPDPTIDFWRFHDLKRAKWHLRHLPGITLRSGWKALQMFVVRLPMCCFLQVLESILTHKLWLLQIVEVHKAYVSCGVGSGAFSPNLWPKKLKHAEAFTGIIFRHPEGLDSHRFRHWKTKINPKSHCTGNNLQHCHLQPLSFSRSQGMISHVKAYFPLLSATRCVGGDGDF